MPATREPHPWPEVPVAEWEDTRDTVQLWTQIVGKTRLALSPPENHWWNVALYVNSVGLTTSLMPYDGYGVEVVFDFTADVLEIVTTRGERRQVRLEPRTVADFYADYLAQLGSLGIEFPIYPKPVELPEAIPFPDDTTHAAYDADAMRRFWTSMVSAKRVFDTFRGQFTGKCSPVHFFWGAFDLAVTRFSGRGAPLHPGGIPNCPDWVMHKAYDAQLSSAGYWPGGGAEGAFYSYAYPGPDGFGDAVVAPDPAYFDESLGEFLLPYTAVRSASDPDALVLEFLQSTYDAAARLADWPLPLR